jgi:hypothetical protein
MDKHIAVAIERRLSLEDVGLSSASPATVREFCDRFCQRLVARYLAEELSWSTADAAANGLYELMIRHCGSRVPDYAWEVYLAFDEGEIDDRADGFTRPRLLEIQSSYGIT